MIDRHTAKVLHAPDAGNSVMVYTPFMRRLDFGTVRRNRNTRVKWLDLHNMLGIVTLCRAFVTGATGVLNTLGVPILNLWQADQFARMVAPYEDKPAPRHSPPSAPP